MGWLRGTGGAVPGAAILIAALLLSAAARPASSRVASSWLDAAGRPTPAARDLLDAIRRAEEHGLDPQDYGWSRIEPILARSRTGPAGASDRGARERLLTGAFLRYASDLSTGRVHPEEVDDLWQGEPAAFDLPSELERALTDGATEELLARLAPPHAGYHRLREALPALRRVASAGGWSVIPDGPALSPGDRGPRVSLLRRRLGAGGRGDRFDAELAARVRRFQAGHGLEPDGIVGPDTLAELNVPVDERIRQIVRNLDRWRWLPRDPGEPHILVNVPAFELAWMQDGAAAWRARVVAGAAWSPTPALSDRVVSVVANPAWNVPHQIAVEEYFPRLRRDPSSLRRKGFQLLAGTGKDEREVDPASVAWDRLDAGDARRFPYRLRQGPGPGNPLGRVKFVLTNDRLIYLHDSPERHLFDEAGRDLSHGCIRVEQPIELAGRLMGSSFPALEEALEQEQERHFPVRPPVSVHILYMTSWVDDEGGLRFAPDVYGLDRLHEDALERRGSGISGGWPSGTDGL